MQRGGSDRMPRRTLTPADALSMRAARAAEDPVAMTSVANALRGPDMARFALEIARENPDLTDDQVLAGARLRIKAHMAMLGERAARAKKDRAAERKAAAGDAA